MIQLEWQLLLTHALGFLITLWILKRYAWKPLLALMEERRNRIINEFQTIEQEKAKVAQTAAQYESKLKEIDAERRAKLVEGVEEGKKIAADIKAQAQREVKDIHDKTKADLEREVAKARVELRDQMVAITMTAAEKVIHEKLDDAKQRQLINRYIAEIEEA
ncbi:MAG TPA: F0F1 ATP synthase subunit B [Candidatus Acidoferrum sp.]|nr:F0F1 ATP synthase subunit B [Candidatus Acidoferrum sp.]